MRWNILNHLSVHLCSRPFTTINLIQSENLKITLRPWDPASIFASTSLNVLVISSSEPDVFRVTISFTGSFNCVGVGKCIAASVHHEGPELTRRVVNTGQLTKRFSNIPIISCIITFLESIEFFANQEDIMKPWAVRFLNIKCDVGIESGCLDIAP